MRASKSGFATAMLLVAMLVEGPVATAAERTAADDLLAADRAWAQAAANQPFPDAIASALADDAFVMLARGRSAQGPEATRKSLAPEAASHATWYPAWAGVSADGTQGFTLGFLTVTPASGEASPGKYLAYWRNTAKGWRVVAYKRRPRAAGDVPTTPAPSLVSAAGTANVHADSLATIVASVDARERAFSDAAQRTSLADAFAHFGHPDAINMGGPANAGFVQGPRAIADAISGGEAASGSSVSWWPDRIVAAASGDLALSIGTLHLNEAPTEAGVPREFPFFTVWYREGGKGEWQYVAE